MKFLVLPNGRRIDLEGTSYTLKDNQTLVINTNGCCESAAGLGDTTDEFLISSNMKTTSEGPTSYSFTAVTPGDAYAMIGAIDSFVGGSGAISNIPVASGGFVEPLTFLTISPETVPGGDVYTFTITGTGFYPELTAALWSVPGYATSPWVLTYISNTKMTLEWGFAAVAGVGTFYYNIGYTDVSTGLNVTVAP